MGFIQACHIGRIAGFQSGGEARNKVLTGDGDKGRLIVLETGLLAMQRTVGFTTSIGAQMILNGEIDKRGVLSPLRDVPPEPFVKALKARGIFVKRIEEKVM